jgi:uncharacterized protein
MAENSEKEGGGPRSATFAARGYLIEILRGQRGAQPFKLRFHASQSLAHIVESIGIPRLEIGAAKVDGELWSLRLPLPDEAFVELLPLEEPLDVPGGPRFALDVHLGRLARHLRLLGFDVTWANDYTEFDLIGLAAAEGRIVLSRDRALLFRREFHGSPLEGMLVRSRESWAQLVEVCRRFGLASRFLPFSLCAACGAPLVPAGKEELLPLLPPLVAERYDEFFVCPACGKPYWKGDHFRSIGPFLERLNLALS